MDEKLCKLELQLRSSDSEERIAVARQLAVIGDPAVPLLYTCLKDEDWRVRKAATTTFFNLHHPEHYSAEIIELLHNQENAGLRNAAIEILIGLGPLAVAELQREIQCPDVEVRKFVIDILGEIGDTRCSEELIAALKDPDLNVRYAVVETLGKLRVKDAAEPMLELMDDSDPGLKFTVLQSLSLIGAGFSVERLLRYVDDRLLRKALFDCFGMLGDRQVVVPLVAGLSDPMRNVRVAALVALFRLWPELKGEISAALAASDGDQIATFLEEILAADEMSLKEAALAFYGQVAQGRDLVALLNCVAEEQIRSRVLAAFAVLGETVFQSLYDALVDEDDTTALYLIYVGGELRYQGCLPLVLEGLRSSNPQLRHASCRALGELGNADHVDLLLAVLEDEFVDIQDAAAAALGAIGKRLREDVLVRISALMSSADADKRMRLLRILSLIDGDGTELLLLKALKDPSASVRCETLRALKGKDSAEVIAGVTLALTDESAEVRRLAVSALGHCSQEQVLPALRLASGDTDLWVRAAVMRSLEHFAGEDVQEILRLGVADAVGLVVIAALESAAVVMPDQAPALLVTALGHPDEEVVKAAMAQLSRLCGKGWILENHTELLNHNHWDVRVHAVNALSAITAQETLDLLEQRLLIEGEALVRQTLETAITRLLQNHSRDSR